jgi:hypothetical protein
MGFFDGGMNSGWDWLEGLLLCCAVRGVGVR